jgi:hypothetical protein
MNRRLMSASFVLTTALGTAGLSVGPVSADTLNGTSHAYGHDKKLPTESGCNDIIDAVGADYTASSGVVRILFDLAAPSCAGTTYTLRVYDGTGTLGSFSMAGDGVSSQLELDATVPAPAAAGSIVGVQVTTSVGTYVVDIAPNPVPLDATTDANANGIQDNAEVKDGSSPALSNFG